MPENQRPLLGVEPTEKGIEIQERLMERFKLTELPPALRVAASSECGIADIYANLNRLFADARLTESSKALLAAAVASTTASNAATRFFADIAAGAGRTNREILDATAVATVCSIFNGTYRFRHQVPPDLMPAFDSFRAPYVANSLMKSALPALEVELICIAVSSINNCHACVESHIAKGKALGLDEEQIDEAIRASAVALAVARLLGALTPV